jgi:hypothetical protein
MLSALLFISSIFPLQLLSIVWEHRPPTLEPAATEDSGVQHHDQAHDAATVRIRLSPSLTRQRDVRGVYLRCLLRQPITVMVLLQGKCVYLASLGSR